MSTPNSTQAHREWSSGGRILGDREAPPRRPPAKTWPLVVIGLGLAALIPWNAALAWLVLHAVRVIF